MNSSRVKSGFSQLLSSHRHFSLQENTFAFYIKWKPKTILQDEGKKIFSGVFRSPRLLHDFCLLHAAIGYPICQRSLRPWLGPVSAPAPNEQRLWESSALSIWHRRAQKSFEKKKKEQQQQETLQKAEGGDMHRRSSLPAGAELLLSSSFKKAVLRGDKHISMFCSFAEQEICPGPALFTQDILLDWVFCFVTKSKHAMLKIEWIIAILT